MRLSEGFCNLTSTKETHPLSHWQYIRRMGRGSYSLQLILKEWIRLHQRPQSSSSSARRTTLQGTALTRDPHLLQLGPQKVTEEQVLSKFRLTGGCQSQRCNHHFYAVNPKNKDCYYMRLLLHEVRGPTSYQDLRVVDGVK